MKPYKIEFWTKKKLTKAQIKDIAATITGTKAVPALPLRIDIERRVLFTMERA